MGKQYELFKVEITRKSDKDIHIKAFQYAGGSTYLPASMYISPASIPELISVLTNREMLSNRHKGDEWDISEYNFENAYDKIEFEYRGSDQEPILTISSDKHVMADGLINEDGIINIPIDPFTRIEEDMKYITPFVEELKKYI